MDLAELRGSSLTIMTGSSPMSVICIGATSIWRLTPRGRPDLGLALALRKAWLDAKKPSADGSLDTFRASAKSAAASASWPSAADSDRTL